MQKRFFLGLTYLCSMSIASAASASDLAKAVYHALNVPEENACTSGECPNAVTTMVKSVGGLTCYQRTEMSRGYPEAYNCSLVSVIDAEEIYLALNVEEKNACKVEPCPTALTVLVKDFGPFSCSVRKRMSHGFPESYSCRAEF